MVFVFGLFIPPPAALLNQTGNVPRADEQEEKLSRLNLRIYVFDQELRCKLYSRKQGGGTV